MDTGQIMAVALAQAGLSDIPSDSAIYVEGGGLRRALFGVDIDISDLLFARQAGFDVVVAHHPLGGVPASPGFTDVIWGMVEHMTAEGVAEPVARSAVAARVATVHRRRHVANYNRVLDTARLIGLPLLNIHLPPDLVTRRYIQDLARDSLGPLATADDLLALLRAIPEMHGSLVKPEQWIGDGANPVGRVMVAIGGGTSGGYPVFRALYEVGVTTIIAMHIDEADLLRLRADEQPHWNLVISGHVPSDSIGINRLIWELEDGGLECTRCSGVTPSPRPPKRGVAPELV